ncbi:6-bladed beta-propeller [Acidobacteriota bacterium]
MAKNRIVKFSLFFLFFTVTSISTGLISSQKKDLSGVDKNVPVVSNPLNPTLIKGQSSQMYITEDLRIGTVKGSDEYMFGEIREIAVDDDGQIFVLDTKKTLINVYDKNGLYKKTIGRHGQGPGELQAPQRMSKTWQDEIFVEDHGARAFVYYTLDGLYSRRVTFSSVFIFTTGIDSLGNIVGVMQTPGEKGNRQVINRYDPELNYMHTLGYPIEENRSEYNYFKSRLKWAAFKGDHIIFAFPENYEFYIYDAQGTLVQKIEKEYKPVRISQEELAYMRSVVRLPATVKNIVPKHHDAFKRITVDDQNRIFVETWEKTKDGNGFIYDVFGPDGLCFARVPLHFNFGRFSLFLNPIVWKNGKVYAREEDEDGYQFVVRYSVHWE